MNAGNFGRLQAKPDCDLLAVVQRRVEKYDIVQRLLSSRGFKPKKDLYDTREVNSRFTIALNK
jgi:hypothetical protein